MSHYDLKRSNVNIRGIWIADMSHQGASGILNEKTQGDDRTLNGLH